MSMNDEAISLYCTQCHKIAIKNEMIFVDVRNVKKARPLRGFQKIWMRPRGHVYPSQVDYHSDVCLLRAMIEIHIHKVCATCS